ncbi:UNVERIFIED_CONTAM: hypothetical protein K2H54_040351 [Gekko kuhli]
MALWLQLEKAAWRWAKMVLPKEVTVGLEPCQHGACSLRHSLDPSATEQARDRTSDLRHTKPRRCRALATRQELSGVLNGGAALWRAEGPVG